MTLIQTQTIVDYPVKDFCGLKFMYFYDSSQEDMLQIKLKFLFIYIILF